MSYYNPDTSPAFVTTTVRMPPDLHVRLKQLATMWTTRRGSRVSVNDVMLRLLDVASNKAWKEPTTPSP